jgi:hypothetical protein
MDSSGEMASSYRPSDPVEVPVDVGDQSGSTVNVGDLSGEVRIELPGGGDQIGDGSGHSEVPGSDSPQSGVDHSSELVGKSSIGKEQGQMGSSEGIGQQGGSSSGPKDTAESEFRGIQPGEMDWDLNGMRD